MEKTVLFAFLAVFLLVGCGRNDNYIIPVDYGRYYEGKSDLTEAESQEINERIMTDMQRATIGKTKALQMAVNDRAVRRDVR